MSSATLALLVCTAGYFAIWEHLDLLEMCLSDGKICLCLAEGSFCKPVHLPMTLFCQGNYLFPYIFSGALCILLLL